MRLKMGPGLKVVVGLKAGRRLCGVWSFRLLGDDVSLVDRHVLGHERFEVENLLAAQVQSMLVESGPLEHLCLQAAVQNRQELSRQRL